MEQTEPAPSAIRVICDRCKTEGLAGDPAFAAIPDILDFAPVPVRTHMNNWTAEHQRAFIAALAMTGSVNQAARAVGRYSAGADRLRRRPGGRAFSEAWDAALEIARDRDLSEMRDNLRGASRQTAAASGRADPSAPGGGPGKWVDRIYGDGYDPDEFLEGHAEMVETKGRIRDRIYRARQFYLGEIAECRVRRAAWELLTGQRVDWDRAERLEPQADEVDVDIGGGPPALPNMRQPDMLLTAQSGWLPEVGVSSEDKMEQLHDLFAEALAEQNAQRLIAEGEPE